MLINLQIKDFLLIDNLELDFFSGLTVITGETGSGKSITIDALMLLFGAKASVDVIRSGQKQASFSATFQVDNQKILSWLNEREFLDTSEQNIIICRRVIDVNGRSKGFINSLPVTLGVLKELGEMLLDIHTQHASIALLKAENQRLLLDEFAKVTQDVQRISVYYQQINELSTKLKHARELSQDLLLKQEFLSEKISELGNLNLQDGEWEKLQYEQKQLANADFVLQELDFALNLLTEESGSLADLATILTQRLAKISEYLPNYTQVKQLTNALDAEIGELKHELLIVARKIERDPHALASLDARIDEIYSLARKYRVRPEELANVLSLWQNELAQLTHDVDIDIISQELATARQNYSELAAHVSKLRQGAAVELSNKVSKLLQQLAIFGEFKLVVSATNELSSFGFDNISFQVCFNQGMGLQPLNKVVSGGELSRLALALYVTLSINNPPEVIIFDEIDVGIGGAIAEIVGKLLHELGEFKQVICITHQAQTACCGNWHIQVQKYQQKQQTLTKIDYIVNEARVEEIARMLGGVQITPTTRKHAKEMLLG